MKYFFNIVVYGYFIVHACTTNTELRLYVFDCGKAHVESVEMFGISDDETDVRVVAMPCYVIEHENGRLLWDGGVSPVFAEHKGWQDVGDGISVILEETLAEQLKDIGLDMASFDYIAFSHMHYDHVGVANELRAGRLIIQQAEYEAAFADEVSVFGYHPDLYQGLRDRDLLLINGDHDVFGDGRVKIISAPGHTPGHQVLFVDLEETGPVVLSGDLYHFPLSREQRRVPVFNVDSNQTLESMQKVEAIIEETGAELWIQHDLANFESRKKSPDYYR